MIDDFEPERLERLLDAAARLPREMQPERDAWPEIRGRIERLSARSIAPHDSVVPATRRNRAWALAAAAIVLVVASSGVTAVILKSRTTTVAAVTRDVPAPVPVERAPIVSPVPVTRSASAPPLDGVFARYDAAATDLLGALGARRARLDPRTVAVLDSCLKRIDLAIAEARTALRENPRDPAITEILTFSYQQKLDLLKRAADLPLASF